MQVSVGCRWLHASEKQPPLVFERGLDQPPLTAMPKAEEVRWSLEFRKVNFSYQQRGVEILKDLSFQVHQGEFLGNLLKRWGF